MSSPITPHSDTSDTPERRHSVPAALPLFSLTVPATIRMTVAAGDAREAATIVAALLGNGEWLAAALSSTDARPLNLPFSVRVND